MANAISMDLRKRIVEAKESGHTIERIAKEKSVSRGTVSNILRLYRETGSYAPLPRRNGKPSCITPELLSKIEYKIEIAPDATLQEIIDELKLPISISMLSKIIKHKLKLNYKKNSSRQRSE
jgi:transposase